MANVASVFDSLVREKKERKKETNKQLPACAGLFNSFFVVHVA